MQQIIDAHAHLFPKGLIGTTNEKVDAVFLPFGKCRKSDGDLVPLMPEFLEDTAFPAERLLQVMNRHSVEKTVLLASSLTVLEENIRAVQQYPDRFAAAMTVSQEECAKDELRHYRREGLTVLKFECSAGLGYTHPKMYPDFRFDSPRMDEIFAACEGESITVAIDPGPIGAGGYQPEALLRAAETWSGLHLVICHLGFPDVPTVREGARYECWQQMCALAARPNVWFDAAALTDFYAAEGYPYPTAAEAVRRFADTYGMEKLLWGSDAPGTLSGSTYRQMIDTYEKSSLFSEAEKALLFRENAIAAYRL